MSARNTREKLRQRIAQFMSESIGDFVGAGLTWLLLVPWAAGTFFISDLLHAENMLSIVFIGILTSPIWIVPTVFATSLFYKPRRDSQREHEAEEFYRSRMKKPDKK